MDINKKQDIAPTFKLVDKVWHLTRFKDLKKGDIVKIFNSPENCAIKNPAIDFQAGPSWICTSDPYISNNGPDKIKAWTVQVVSHKNDS